MGLVKAMMYEHDDELDNLPDEAFESFGGRYEIDKYWLKDAGDEDQKVAMFGWFKRNYYYPADLLKLGTPPSKIYANGGPFNPNEILWNEFGKSARKMNVMEVIAELRREAFSGWAEISYVSEDDYDEAFDVELSAAGEPLSRLYNRNFQIAGLLQLTGAEPAMQLAERMAFSAAIAALESFLYETMLYWIDADEQTLKNIVEGLPEFREEKYKVNLYDIFDKMESLKNDVKGYMQNMVWHNWKRVVPLLRIGLAIKTPSFAQFDSALLKRHDIVHRSGHTKDGEEIAITRDEIRELCSQITAFAAAINEAINVRDGGGF